MPDRDVVLKATIEPMTAKKPYVVIKMVSIPDFIPSRAPFVRMTAENYVIKFTPQGKDKTLLESEGFIDPGSVSPSWAINYIQGKGLHQYEGMQRMKMLKRLYPIQLLSKSLQTYVIYYKVTCASSSKNGSNVVKGRTITHLQSGVACIVDYRYFHLSESCLLYTSPSPRDGLLSRMPSSA